MQASFWVKIEGKKSYGRWNMGAVEVRKSKPATKANEIAIKVSLEIPDSYFDTPEFQAKITISEDQISKPVITANVQENIGKILSEQLGLKVHITADEQE